MRLLRADLDLHNGRLAEAAARLDEPAGTDMWWQTTYEATRAEALVRADDPRASDALAAAQASIGDHGYATGILLRARGLRDRDDGLLQRAIAQFDQIECPYQAARTRWLVGDAERARRRRRSSGWAPPRRPSRGGRRLRSRPAPRSP